MNIQKVKGILGQNAEIYSLLKDYPLDEKITYMSILKDEQPSNRLSILKQLTKETKLIAETVVERGFQETPQVFSFLDSALQLLSFHSRLITYLWKLPYDSRLCTGE